MELNRLTNAGSVIVLQLEALWTAAFVANHQVSTVVTAVTIPSLALVNTCKNKLLGQYSCDWNDYTTSCIHQYLQEQITESVQLWLQWPLHVLHLSIPASTNYWVRTVVTEMTIACLILYLSIPARTQLNHQVSAVVTAVTNPLWITPLSTYTPFLIIPLSTYTPFLTIPLSTYTSFQTIPFSTNTFPDHTLLN